MTIKAAFFPILVFAGLFAIVLLNTNGAHAGPIFTPGGDDDPIFADDACDPDYYESLRSRAWLEAQREITQNQNLIAKPDSVLEYTCFDAHLNHMANIARNDLFFSQTTRWGTPAGNMNTALSPLANAIRAYDTSNFNHTLLGGRMGTSPSSNNYTFSGSVSSSGYSCDTMNRVWEAAKCMDFINSPDHDGFFTFENYANNPDRRFLAPACSGAPAPYADNINIAYMSSGTPWVEDQVSTYFDLAHPEDSDCGDASSRLETGLLIFRTNETPNEYDEHICVVPGCFYNPAEDECQRPGN